LKSTIFLGQIVKLLLIAHSKQDLFDVVMSVLLLFIFIYFICFLF
jgi:hypothetical protein